MNIQTFSFANQSLQIIIKDNQAWFIAREVANLLGYRDAHNLTRILDDDEKGTHNMSTLGGNQDVTIINESGFYHAAFKSRKAEVKPFRKWVTNEVLPSIRKTGSYTVSDNPKKLSNKTTTTERTGLRNAVNLLVSKKGLNYSEAYSMVHQRFNVESIEDLSRSQLNEAVEYVHRVVLEGEVLDKEPLLSKSEFKALMHMFSKLCTYTMALRDLQNDLMLEERKLCYWFSRLNHAPEEGFFFFFKPNVNRDLDDAASIVHRYKKLIA